VPGSSVQDSASDATPGLTRPVILIAAVIGILMAGTIALWAHYGTAVFYEMIVAGLVACF
jgi:hypothetical protein